MVNFPQKSTDHYGTENILMPNLVQAVVDFREIFSKEYIILLEKIRKFEVESMQKMIKWDLKKI